MKKTMKNIKKIIKNINFEFNIWLIIFMILIIIPIIISIILLIIYKDISSFFYIIKFLLLSLTTFSLPIVHEIFHAIAYATIDKERFDLEINYFLKGNNDRPKGTYVLNNKILNEDEGYTKKEMKKIYLYPLYWGIIWVAIMTIGIKIFFGFFSWIVEFLLIVCAICSSWNDIRDVRRMNKLDCTLFYCGIIKDEKGHRIGLKEIKKR